MTSKSKMLGIALLVATLATGAYFWFDGKRGSIVPPTGIVKVTSSYKAGDNTFGCEICVELLEWGNDLRKVSNRKLDRNAAGGNPFLHPQNLRVGDYVVYNVTEKGRMFASGQVTMKSTLAVSEVDEKVASVETISDLFTVDLTKPFDTCTAVAMIPTPGYGWCGIDRNMARVPFGFQKTGDGEETIKIGDKAYECTWIEGQVDTTVHTQADDKYKFTAEMKIWIAKDKRTQP
jgi:hypothetical protein